MLKIVDIVKDNKAIFSFYRSGKMYYTIVDSTGKALWEFPIDITDTNDIGNATLVNEFKAITLMRYVRKAIDNETLIAL